MLAWCRAEGNLVTSPVPAAAARRQDPDSPVAALMLLSLVLLQATNAFEGEHLLSVVPMLVAGLSC